MINTLLNNIYLKCHRFIYKEVGYFDDAEKVACCEQMIKEIYILGDSKYKSLEDRLYNCEPITSTSAKILIDLNLYRRKRINNILRHGFFFNISPVKIDELKKIL